MLPAGLGILFILTSALAFLLGSFQISIAWLIILCIGLFFLDHYSGFFEQVLLKKLNAKRQNASLKNGTLKQGLTKQAGALAGAGAAGGNASRDPYSMLYRSVNPQSFVPLLSVTETGSSLTGSSPMASSSFAESRESLLNTIIGMYFSQFAKSRFPADFRAQLNRELRQVFTQLPSLVKTMFSSAKARQNIEIKSLNIGSAPPRIANLTCRKVSEDVLHLDFDALYTGDARLEVSLHTMGGGMKIKVSDLQIQGRMRLEWEFYSAPSFTRNLSLAFVSMPTVNLKVTAASVALNDVPILGERIRSDLLGLPKRMVLPEKWWIVRDENELSKLRDVIADYVGRESTGAASSPGSSSLGNGNRNGSGSGSEPGGNHGSKLPRMSNSVDADYFASTLSPSSSFISMDAMGAGAGSGAYPGSSHSTSTSDTEESPAKYSIPRVSTPLRPLANIKNELDDVLAHGTDNSAQIAGTILHNLRLLFHSQRKVGVDPMVFGNSFTVLERLMDTDPDSVLDVILQPDNFAFLCCDVAERCSWADNLLLKLFSSSRSAVRERVNDLLDDLECRYVIYEIRSRHSSSNPDRLANS
eukprot:ANDGO_03288.mRNA.1 hypothetical protein